MVEEDVLNLECVIERVDDLSVKVGALEIGLTANMCNGL